MSGIADASSRVTEVAAGLRDELAVLVASGPIVSPREVGNALRLCRLAGAVFEGALEELRDAPLVRESAERRPA